MCCVLCGDAPSYLYHPFQNPRFIHIPRYAGLELFWAVCSQQVMVGKSISQIALKCVIPTVPGLVPHLIFPLLSPTVN